MHYPEYLIPIFENRNELSTVFGVAIWMTTDVTGAHDLGSFWRRLTPASYRSVRGS